MDDVYVYASGRRLEIQTGWWPCGWCEEHTRPVARGFAIDDCDDCEHRYYVKGED